MGSASIGHLRSFISKNTVLTALFFALAGFITYFLKIFLIYSFKNFGKIWKIFFLANIFFAEARYANIHQKSKFSISLVSKFLVNLAFLELQNIQHTLCVII